MTKDAPSSYNYSVCSGYSSELYSAPMMYLRHDDNNDILFNIGTGSNVSSIGHEFTDFLKENKKDKLELAYNSISVDISEISDTPNYILKGMTFNDMLIGDIIVHEKDKYVLGMDFLSRFKNYTFIPSRMMFCYNTPSIKHIYTPPIRRITISDTNKRLELLGNTDEDLSGMGLKNGDIILIANNKKYDPSQIDDLIKVLSETPKNELKLMIQRGKQQLELQI